MSFAWENVGIDQWEDGRMGGYKNLKKVTKKLRFVKYTPENAF